MIDSKKFEIPSIDTYKLEGMRKASLLVGSPELGRKTILVAGTNGKGSTCAWLTKLFQSRGLKVGTYSSPHVISRTERIRINGKPITESKLRKYEKIFAEALEPLTYFERLTLLAFLIFRNQKVDLQILEVGIGGRLDATNICDPDFCAITSVDYDHQDVLGPRLEDIAREKAGILRSGRAVYLQPQRKRVLRILKQEIRQKGALLRGSIKVRFSPPLEKKMRAIAKKFGAHQEKNARLATELFQEAALKWGLRGSVPKILKALGDDLWSARIEVVRKRPVFIVDGAHNPHALQVLLDYLRRQARGLKFHLVFGALKDKPALKMARMLSGFASKIYLPIFYPERQIPTEALARVWSRVLGSRKAKERVRLDSNLPILTRELFRIKEPVLVVGSFYLAGKVLKILKVNKGA